MAPAHTIHPHSPTAPSGSATGNAVSSAYPACPLADRPSRHRPQQLTWEELLGQR